MKRDYVSAPVADNLGLHGIISGLAGDLEAMRQGQISPQEGIARATVAKQLFNGVRLYLQAVKTMEGMARQVDQSAPATIEAQGGGNG